MLNRVEDQDNPVPLVLACVAYYNYKLEKREWIANWTEQNGDKPLPKDVDYFVSTWTDLSIDRAFASARQDIENFAEAVVESAKEDLRGEVYQTLFRGLSDQIKNHSSSSKERVDSLSNLITERTKSHWLRAVLIDIVVSLFGNIIWLFITIAIVVGAYVQFDLGKIAEKAKNLLPQQEQTEPQSQK